MSINEFSIENLLDDKGRVFRWPKKKLEKYAVLLYLHRKMTTGKIYSEKEVNEIIMQWHSFGDYALLRREMFDNFLLERTKDGKEYWINEKGENE
jgi:hypothetical protein